MKTSFELVAEFRDAEGKGASRRLRRANKVPAILYGGHREPRALSLDHTKLLLMLDNERFYSTIINLRVGDVTQAAVLKDVQRHPAKNAVIHIDLQRVLENEKIRISIPLHFKGEAAAPGVKKGGLVSHLRNEVEISCLPKDLPEYIDVDLSGLDMNQMLYLGDLKVPEGVEIPELTHGRNAPVVSIHHARAEEAETPAAEAAAGTVAAPAAAAPAAAAKPAAEAKKEAKK
ncbi:MAG: 50S ribosomal protein L25/general stress protein Ctc [Steroidobacteraceae bacterium]|jgi:large subunit ribosomal protein L25|nr:50S ribosomal protein L25/general stress protein Ctc [Steroidobacteraceae bacterium]